MKLHLGPEVIRSYKRLPYTAWHALGEFVDNSTQNYFDHREVLDEAYAADDEDGLAVRISYDRVNSMLRISDNALGMGEEELERALTVGLPPDDPSGRSRYGLGLKMAASWFGDHWTIVTKKLGATQEFTVQVDVEAIASGETDLQTSTVDDLPESSHYTRIEITSLNRSPQGRTVGKIREFLAGMYRPDIERGDLTLEWYGEVLSSELKFEFLKDAAGNDYRKSFDFAVGPKSVRGWVGIHETGSRQKGGFAIQHQGRMVRTWPDAWKPVGIFGRQFGGSNDLINQRLVGELFLDDFEISHTKDDIQWDNDEQEDKVTDRLLEVVSDYRAVARETRKKGGVSKTPAVQAAVKKIEAELSSGELGDLVEADLPDPEAVTTDDAALVEETDVSIHDFVAEFPFNQSTVRVTGILDTNRSPNDPYVISQSTQDDEVLVIVNLNHPFLGYIEENDLLSYLRQCMYDALTEWRARRQHAPIDPITFRRLKDGFLRLPFEIEMHEEPTDK